MIGTSASRVWTALKVTVATAGLLLLCGCTGPSEVSAPQESLTPSSSPTYDTMEKWIGAVVGCLHENGWDDATVTNDGQGIEIESLPQEQHEAYRATREACEDQSGTAPNAVPPNEEMIKEQYDHLLTSVGCIESMGYEVSETPPSEETFVDDYLSGRAVWSPFLALSKQLTTSEWEDLIESCPQTQQ